ncbi:hypothetical protein [Mumia sp. DW29H23]|uniref:hypothetical protein n=1 Tax=Mumia sp. DW29H23 TaxID=3421241 RepID=UPI003D689349
MGIAPSVRPAELQRQSAALLPARETLCHGGINVAPVVAVNIALAVNAASIAAHAQAVALQGVGVRQ